MGAILERERGKTIDSLPDLVLCYYSSIQVTLYRATHEVVN